MTDWSKLKVTDLKAELKNRGLAVNGLKAELVARLEDSDQENPSAAVENEDASVTPADDAVAEVQDTETVLEAPTVDVATEEARAETADPAGDAPAEELAQPAAHDTQAETPAEPLQAVENKERGEESLGDHPPERPDITSDTAPAPEPTIEAQPIPQAPEPSASAETRQQETAVEPAAESQKRKRRSASPQPDAEEVSRKRARAEAAADDSDSIAPAVRLVDEAKLPAATSADEKMPDGEELDHPSAAATTINPAAAASKQEAVDQVMQDDSEYTRYVAPALHPATSALYINNLMRPLRPNDVRAHLAGLAAPYGQEPDDAVIVDFYLDHIRTHAFVVFDSVAAAARARSALHDCVWPNESNRKTLWVDFVPVDKVQGWIEMEESSRSGRSGARWEVIYDNGPDGVEARLESGAMSSSRGNPNQDSRFSGPAAERSVPVPIPLGPRGYRDAAPPTGPRAVRPGSGPGPRPPPSSLDTAVERTRAHPVVTYQMVSEDLAARRTANMRALYTRDVDRDLGRDINRYSFEDGDAFVDRGKEVFEGIRPPHRDRRGPGRGGFGGRAPPRRGAPSFRPRSDRYLPGLDDSRNDRRPRYDDDNDRDSYRSRDRDRR